MDVGVPGGGGGIGAARVGEAGPGAVGEEVLRLLSAAVSADAKVAMRETRLSVALLAAAHTDRDYHADGLDEESLSFLRCGNPYSNVCLASTFEGATNLKECPGDVPNEQPGLVSLRVETRSLADGFWAAGLGCPPV